MNKKDYIGKVVISTKTKTRYILTEITSPEIRAKTIELNSSGYPSHYVWKTINGDPFSNGYLIFEDETLNEKFKKTYDEYCHSEDAYWEEYGYWMRRD
jgi:hypothetical protein